MITYTIVFQIACVLVYLVCAKGFFNMCVKYIVETGTASEEEANSLSLRFVCFLFSLFWPIVIVVNSFVRGIKNQ